MSERRHSVRYRGRSSSPQRPLSRSLDFSPSRSRKYTSYIPRGRERCSDERGTSRKIEKRDDFDRHFNPHAPRALEYVNRDRGRYMAGQRRHKSPLRIRSPHKFKKKHEFERCNDSLRNKRLPDYENAAAETYKDGPHSVRRVRSYDKGSYQCDNLLDGPRKPDYRSVNDCGGPRDYIRVYEKDYYSQYMDNAKPAFDLGYRGGDGIMPMTIRSSDDLSSHRPSISSCYLNSDADKLANTRLEKKCHLEKKDGGPCDEENHLREKNRDFSLCLDRFLGVDKRMEEENYAFKNRSSLLFSQGKGDYTHPREYVSVSSDIMKEGFRVYSPCRDHGMPSKLSQTSSGLTSHPTGFDGYDGAQFDDTKRSSRLYRLPQVKRDDEFFAECVRSKIGSTSTRLAAVKENSSAHNVSRSATFNSAVDEYLHKKSIRDNGQWGPYSFTQIQSLPDDRLDASNPLHPRLEELGVLGAGSSHLNDEIDGYHEYGNVARDNHHLHYSRADGDEWSHDKRSAILESRGYKSHALSSGGFHDSPRKNFNLMDINLDDSIERTLRNKHRDEVLHEQDVGIRTVADGSGARKICNLDNTGGQIGYSNFSKKPSSGRANYEESWSEFPDIANVRPNSSRIHPCKPGSRDIKKRLGPLSKKRHVSVRLVNKYRPSVMKRLANFEESCNGVSDIAKGCLNSSRFHPCKSGSGDIKKRLGPVSKKLHVTQRLVNKNRPSVMKRLAPAPPKKRRTLPWIKNMSSKFPEAIKDSDGSPHDREGDHSGDHLPHLKPEPHEESHDFKQLVKSAFFKYLKQINEMPAKRKYLENGQSGSLKCVVCGSVSDEFTDTGSLARHALTSEKVGLRSQHLGLHRALCAVMSWKAAEEPVSEWLCELISNAESAALKEDLIIWPPLVIVYNSTMDEKNPDECVVLSPETLEMDLRDMGFESIVKVCNGKPADQSIMLVKFNGTLSGLQEADRYHNRYLESKHGRAELNQLNSENQMLAHVASGNRDREEDFLYGHLGIVEDLDKLDFDTKRRCVLRSKGEILSMV